MPSAVQLKMDQLPPLRALRRFLDELAVFQNDTPAEERPHRPHIMLEEVTSCWLSSLIAYAPAVVCMARALADSHDMNLCASILPSICWYGRYKAGKHMGQRRAMSHKWFIAAMTAVEGTPERLALTSALQRE